jgi:hypothetical protein
VVEVSVRDRDRIAGQAGVPASGRSEGKALAPTVRRNMEARLGHSFADVRVHSDASAAGEARTLGARAFAIGRDVVFGAGQFAPGTPAGKALLAHELAHVVQQREPGEGDPARAEAEAASAGRAVAGGRSFAPSVRTGPQVALQEEGEDEMAVRDVPAIREEFEEEQISFTRDRIAAATYSIRRGIAQLNKLKASERPALRTQIYGLERELADAMTDNVALLERRIPELEARVAAGENKTELLVARRELAENRADLESLRGAFSPATGAAFEETYRRKVAGMHCMAAAYTGLGTLTSPEQSAEVERQVAAKAQAARELDPDDNIDQFITVMETAHAEHMAGSRQTAQWSRKRERWTPTLESIVRSRVSKKVPGYYVFGLALAMAYHSVLIGVSTWGRPRTLWCDQNGCTVVPGSLDAFALALLDKHRSAGRLNFTNWTTYVWQVQPPAPEGKP